MSLCRFSFFLAALLIPFAGTSRGQAPHFSLPETLPALPDGGTILDVSVNPNGHLTLVSKSSDTEIQFWDLDENSIYTNLGATDNVWAKDPRHLPDGELLYSNVAELPYPPWNTALSFYYQLMRHSDGAILVSGSQFHTSYNSQYISYFRIQHDRDGYPIWSIGGTYTGRNSMGIWAEFLDSRDGSPPPPGGKTSPRTAVARQIDGVFWRKEGEDILSIARQVDDSIDFTNLDQYPVPLATTSLPTTETLSLMRFVDLDNRRVVVYRHMVSAELRALTLWRDGSQDDNLLVEDYPFLSATERESLIGGPLNGDLYFLQFARATSTGPLYLIHQDSAGAWSIDKTDSFNPYQLETAATDTTRPAAAYTIYREPEIRVVVADHPNWFQTTIPTESESETPRLLACGRDASGQFLVVYTDDTSGNTAKIARLEVTAEVDGWLVD